MCNSFIQIDRVMRIYRENSLISSEEKCVIAIRENFYTRLIRADSSKPGYTIIMYTGEKDEDIIRRGFKDYFNNRKINSNGINGRNLF